MTLITVQINEKHIISILIENKRLDWCNDDIENNCEWIKSLFTYI